MFSIHTKRRSRSLMTVFENIRFCDESVWTVGLTGEIKLHIQISPT